MTLYNSAGRWVIMYDDNRRTRERKVYNPVFSIVSRLRKIEKD